MLNLVGNKLIQDGTSDILKGAATNDPDKVNTGSLKLLMGATAKIVDNVTKEPTPEQKEAEAAEKKEKEEKERAVAKQKEEEERRIAAEQRARQLEEDLRRGAEREEKMLAHLKVPQHKPI